MTVNSIEYQHKKINYQVTGQGAPVMLIHGFAEDSHVWREQVPQLSAQYRLIIPDLPGSGGSAMLEDMGLESLAHCMKAILDAECTGEEAGQPRAKPIVIGHSMGGYITLALVAMYKDAVSGLGLFHSSAFADTEERKNTRRRGIDFIQKHGSYEFIKQSTPNLFTEKFRIENNAVVEDMINRYGTFDPAALVAYYEAMIQRPDRTAILRSFGKPVLFIIGKQDKAIPFNDSMQQCHLPEVTSIHILENSAHMGMWEEKEKSSEALLSYLAFTQQFSLRGTTE
ncbi:MAG TPA: alpha/beta hydrolase [Chitinophagaceae bacterium]|nr:alpha/beta hydrolase [Chitinophagaceae bacterium]